MDRRPNPNQALAAEITRKGSKQTYYTIRFFVDRGLTGSAYQAYGYFRWLDDVLDGETKTDSERLAFIQRQQSLLEASYRGGLPDDLSAEEWMLADLVRSDTEKDSGLRAYLINMMEVMAFDARRRNWYISEEELDEYARHLATAVTEAMHYFIGHEQPRQVHADRYAAVTGAHIIHMLRDAIEDVEAGYFNIPGEYLRDHNISVRDVDSRAYRLWVCRRIQQARACFKAGRGTIARLSNLRCRLAGYAYMARFDWMLRAIQRDNYCLRSEYQERKSLQAGLWMAWSTLQHLFSTPGNAADSHLLAVQPVRIKEL